MTSLPNGLYDLLLDERQTRKMTAFKSRIQPCREVLAASGAQCQYFAARPNSPPRRER